MFTVLAEVTCQWEHRLDSKWVIILHAADNFLFPRRFGETIAGVLHDLNETQISGLEIPMMLSFSRLHFSDEVKNVLQQWRILDEIDNLLD
jgi:hypothetical protein